MCVALRGSHSNQLVSDAAGERLPQKTAGNGRRASEHCRRGLPVRRQTPRSVFFTIAQRRAREALRLHGVARESLKPTSMTLPHLLRVGRTARSAGRNSGTPSALASFPTQSKHQIASKPAARATLSSMGHIASSGASWRRVWGSLSASAKTDAKSPLPWHSWCSARHERP